MQKLHNMSYVSAYLKSYSTRPIVLPKLPASVINLDFLKISHENRDTSSKLAGGAEKGDFRVPPFNVNYLVVQRVQSI